MYKNKLKQLLNSKLYVKYKLNYTQLKHLLLLFKYYYGPDNKLKYKKEQTFFKYLYIFIENGDITQIIQRLIDSDCVGVTLKKMVAMYGQELGTKKFDEYREKQAQSNTFEYKSKKYGMNLKEFSEYNKSRSVTLENMIKKYGQELGTKKFDEYREKQAYTNTLPYFEQKYGKIDGSKKYKEVNKLKTHCFESYKLRFPNDSDEQLEKRLERYLSRTSYSFFSKEATLFCEEIDKLFKDEKVYYGKKNKEFGILDKDTKKYYFYDFCLPERKIIIEYNGDYVHANPRKYKPDDMIVFRGFKKQAKEIWEQDNIKLQTARKRNFDILVIWEDDWKNRKQEVLEKIKKYVENK